MRFYLTARQRLFNLMFAVVVAALLAAVAPGAAILVVLLGVGSFVVVGRWFTGLRQDGVVLNTFRRRLVPWGEIASIDVTGAGSSRVVRLSVHHGPPVRLVAPKDTATQRDAEFDAKLAQLRAYAAEHGVSSD
jgi:hypothetical protein